MAQDDLLIQEDLEITAVTAGAAPVVIPQKVASIFPALTHRNFQLYFFGQAISLIGFWLHQVSLGWLVLQMTHSAFWVGAVTAIAGLPVLFFTIFAGVIIDKINKQKLLVITQVAEAAAAIILGILVLTNTITLPLVIFLSFTIGTVAAIDLPARLTFLVEMVGKEDLASAIPINNGLFNAARFIGPAIGGFLIVTTGMAWPFILNGISFIAGIWAILKVKPVYHGKTETDIHPLESLKKGLDFSFSHPKIVYFMVLAATTAIFLWPYQTLMPLIAENVFNTGAQGYGSLLSAAGAGSLIGAIFTSSQSKRKYKGNLVIMGILLSGLSFILFAINRNYLFAHVLLFISGFGLLTQVSINNTLVQLNSPDELRGRVMAIYLTMFVGIIPLGNIIAGIIAQHTSTMFTVGLGGAAILILGAIYYFKGIFSKFSAENA